jgi:excisionase family DNA binding protein
MDTERQQTITPFLLTARQAAKLLSISERTLYAFTKDGTLPVVRLGRSVRYSLEDLREWIRGHSGKKCENNQNCA